MDKVRFGVIGVGGMGSGHCGMLGKIDETVLTAVCDVDDKTLENIATKFNVPGFSSHIELLESGLIDAVTIATPHYFHPTIAIDAFKRGIHVLSEKPLSVTVSQADAMIQAAKDSGKKFGVVYQMRSEPRYRAAKAIIDSGRLGEIYRTSLIMGWYRSQAYYNSGGWRATWNGEGGGVLINQAPHLLDMFSWLAGLPVSVTAQTRTRLHDIEVEDEAFATLQYANGAHGYLYASTTEAPAIDRIEICGYKGKLVLEGHGIKLDDLDVPIDEFTKTSTQMWSGPQAKSAQVELPEEFPHQQHSAIIHEFASAILHDTPQISPGQGGLNAVELINSVILSSKTGKTVSLPVNRAEYDHLIEELKASSREKGAVKEIRETDPHYV